MNKKKEHPFEEFLKDFIPQISRKSKQLNQALWILETTGSLDAADLKASLDTEAKLLFHDPLIYQKLLAWAQDPLLTDPLLKRELHLLTLAFKENQIPKEILEKIAQKEAILSYSYASFRASFEGKEISENEIREILKKEKDISRRKLAWEASKEVGVILAPQILELVDLRNQEAHLLGYSDYFQMQLSFQEVDPSWLSNILDDAAKKSESSYEKCLKKMGKIAPWDWSDPFAQEDPVDSHELDDLLEGVDSVESSVQFYQKMGIDVAPIIARSDMYERPNKSQHAFCTNIDRGQDIRTLNNVRSSIKWLETILHELGHAIYELGFNPQLPWLLRQPPHMITTEAMALLAGRQAYSYASLGHLVGNSSKKELLRKKADTSLQRRQLIFSRWVLVMTFFEKELYRNPRQDLNALWWELVQKYQKITPPSNREGKADWAAKYHIGLAPVYYFSYLLGEFFASSIQQAFLQSTGASTLATSSVGQFLQKKLFYPGNQMRWDQLVEHVTGSPLTSDAWVSEFCNR